MDIGVWIAICGVVIAALSLIYSALKDTRKSAREDGKMSEILRDIKDRLKSLDDGQKASDLKLEAIIERLAKVEESAKSAHHRIDEIVNKNK